LPLFLIKKNRNNLDIAAAETLLPNFKEFIGIVSTFVLTTFGWIFFRAENLPQAFHYISILFSKSLFAAPYAYGIGLEKMLVTLTAIVFMVIIEWFGRKKECPIWYEKSKGRYIEFIICYIAIMVLFLFGAKQQDFIYFQF
jgi:hypothetical protein